MYLSNCVQGWLNELLIHVDLLLVSVRGSWPDLIVCVSDILCMTGHVSWRGVFLHRLWIGRAGVGILVVSVITTRFGDRTGIGMSLICQSYINAKI